MQPRREHPGRNCFPKEVRKTMYRMRFDRDALGANEQSEDASSFDINALFPDIDTFIMGLVRVHLHR